MFDSIENKRQRPTSDYRLLWSFVVIGIVSGLLSIIFTLSLIFVGAWLALVAVAFLWIFRGLRSIARSLGFIAASAIAFYAAMMTAIFTPKFGNSYDPASTPPHDSGLLIGGIVGGFIVFLAAFLLFCPGKKTWRAPLEALLWSLPCGVLGVVGWTLGPTLGRALSSMLPLAVTVGGNSKEAPFFYSLFLVWQTGVGFLLGFALVLEVERSSTAFAAKRQDASANIQKKGLSIAAIALIVCAVLPLLWLLVTNLPREYSSWRWRSSWHEHLSQVPSLENLPAVESRPLDQALVLHEIAGGVPTKPWETKVNYASAAYPVTLHYEVHYLDKNTPPPPESRPVAEIEILEYPNAAWARFQLWDLPIGPVDPRIAPKVLKFGNRVMTTDRTHTGGDGYYYWVSANSIVTLRLHNTNEDSFLQEYLAKYPSSPSM